MKRDSILCRQDTAKIDLDNYRVDELKKIARFWVGKEAAKFRKNECIEALKKVFQSPKTVRDVIVDLSQPEKTILGIYRRFGPMVSGAVLSAELQARGLAEPEDKSAPSYNSYRRQRSDKITKLRDKLLLMSLGGYYDSYHYSSFYARSYPTLILHPNLGDVIPPASPVLWKSSGKSPAAKSGGFRSSAEVALELWQVAESLQVMGNWKTLKGGSLSKGSQNRLHKLVGFPTAEAQPSLRETNAVWRIG